MTTGRELSLIVEANISRATGAPDTSVARGRKSAWTLGREHLGIQSELIGVRLEVFEANSTISEKDKPVCANRYSEKGQRGDKLRKKLTELLDISLF